MTGRTDAREIRPLPGHIPAVVRERVEADLAALRDGERFALIAGLDLEGARLAIVARATAWGGEWTFSGYTSHEWGGDTTVGARIVFPL